MGTEVVSKDFAWGYTWNNDNAAWTNQANPPPPAGEVSARTDLGPGDIVGIYGITGIPWWR